MSPVGRGHGIEALYTATSPDLVCHLAFKVDSRFSQGSLHGQRRPPEEDGARAGAETPRHVDAADVTGRRQIMKTLGTGVRRFSSRAAGTAQAAAPSGWLVHGSCR